MFKSIALAACLCGAAAADTVDQAIYPGRSGDVAFTGSAPAAASHLIFVGVEKVADGARAIAETSVAPLVAHIAGALPTAFPAALPSAPTSVLAPASGVLLLNVEGMSAEQAQGLPHLSSLLASSHSVELKPDFEPRDSVAAAVSRLAGTTPSDHGIAAKAWICAKTGQLVHAFEAGKDAAASRVANLADLLGQSSAGHSLMISMSADPQLAAAAGPHPSLAREAGASWPSAVLTYDEESRAFKPSQAGAAMDEGALTVTFAEAKAALERVAPKQMAQLESEDPVAVAKLVAELGSPLVLLGKVAADPLLAPLVGDKYTDLVVISVASLTGVLSGSAAALAVADAAVPAIVDAYKRVWGEGGRVQVTLNPAEPADEVEAPEGWTVVGHRAFGPSAAEQKAEGCGHFTATLSGTATAVHCLLHRQGRRLQEDEVEPFTISTGFSSDELELYQVTLWATVLLVVAIIVGSCALYNMEITQDSLLFSKEKGM